MPYVEGETLRDRLNREKQLTIEDATRIASDLEVDAADAATDITVQLIGNDTDPDNGRSLDVTGIDSTGTRGIVVRSNRGRVLYSPGGEFDDLSVGDTATDTFQYQVTDRDGAVAIGTVTVVITGADADGGNTDNSSHLMFDDSTIRFDAQNIVIDHCRTPPFIGPDYLP